MNLMASSTDAYAMEKLGSGMRLLMLSMCLAWGEERSMMRCFFPEYLHVTTPRWLMRYVEKGWAEKGPIIHLESNSFWRRELTASQSYRADWRLEQMVL